MNGPGRHGFALNSVKLRSLDGSCWGHQDVFSPSKTTGNFLIDLSDSFFNSVCIGGVFYSRNEHPLDDPKNIFQQRSFGLRFGDDGAGPESLSNLGVSNRWIDHSGMLKKE